ncbi:MAG: hypothetical protein MMC33_005971 [Icmadophila ericetorum]|nr:hypothetical protein [Icmadophila ericetorum]
MPIFCSSIRSLRLRQCGQRAFSSSAVSKADFTHVVIGAGVVGLAVARKLATHPSTSTLLIERHGSAGTETSSRNSEVIHAGLYYGHGTLKTKLCIRGREMLYELCQREGIPHRNTRKWVVAQDEQQMQELEKVHTFSKEIGVPTHFLSKNEVSEREPEVLARAGVLESPTTGIVDSHALMTYLEGSFQSVGGETAYHTSVSAISHLANGDYELTTTSPSSFSSESTPPSTTITTSTLINCAGLYAIPVSNMILPPKQQLQPFYAKGTYFSYSAPHPKPSTLIYPAPKPGFGGLGTHLTLDMANRVRFGPDVEWIDDPTDYTPNTSRVAAALDEIQTYLPRIQRDKIEVDYCGIRPKLGKSGAVSKGKGFMDFVIREEGDKGFQGFVNLLGIESPGLTSSLAIGEMVEGLLYR